MSDIHENHAIPPSEDELKKLPLRALAAFASRCARRVKPIFLLPSSDPNIGRDTIAINSAILTAEEYARGRNVSSIEAHAAAAAALTAVESAQKIPTGFQAFHAALSAAEAAHSVYAAASELSSNNAIAAKAAILAPENIALEEVITIVRAEHTANFAARCSAFAANATPTSIVHMIADYNKLLSLGLGEFLDIGAPIDPSEEGPLGSLWPNGASTWYAVDQSHPYYNEILQFYVSATSLSALMWASIVDKEIRQPRSTIIETPKGQARLVALPSLKLETHLLELGCNDECIFSPASTIDYLVGNSGPPFQLFFAVRPLVWPSLDESKISGKLERHLGQSTETLACYLVGGAFERFKNHFRQKYGKDINWPPELKFFRHLRNGCFHENSFNMQKRRDGRDQIDQSNPPAWHTYVMSSDAAMTGKVIDGFFRIPHVLPFLHDMGKLV